LAILDLGAAGGVCVGCVDRRYNSGASMTMAATNAALKTDVLVTVIIGWRWDRYCETTLSSTVQSLSSA
jgi:hypothetical protein